MAGRLFDKLEQEAFRAGIAARTKESMAWFQDRVSNVNVSRAALLKDGPTRARQVYGSMYNFQYDPKTKQTLPYYDRFPLIIVTRVEKEWFEGINFHYLMYEHRAILMDRMYRFLNSDDFNNPNTRLMTLKWNRLERIGSRKYQRSCVRRYINNQVRGKFIKILPAEWDLCLMLPIERFIGASRNKVWTEGRQKW